MRAITPTTTQFSAHIKAFASVGNPLQTLLDIVLTDFSPNANKQCVPRSEADNLVMSAKHRPIKINIVKHGHEGSYPIGVLTDVYLDGDVVRAKSTLWRDEYPEEDAYLRKATAEGKTVQTSWELYYKDSEMVDGVEMLRDITFAAQTIVNQPAYEGRTPILSIAEKANMEELETLKTQIDELQAVIKDIQTVLTKSEQALAEMDNAKTVAEVRKLVAEHDALTSAIAEERAAIAKAEKRIERRKQLSVLTDDEFKEVEDVVLDMQDESFKAYVTSIFSVSQRASATKVIDIPEPFSKNTTSIVELAAAIKAGK